MQTNSGGAHLVVYPSKYQRSYPKDPISEKIRYPRAVLLLAAMVASIAVGCVVLSNYITKKNEKAAAVDNPVQALQTFTADSGDLTSEADVSTEEILPQYPEAIVPVQHPYPTVAVFIDGKISDKGYSYHNQTYLNIAPYLEAMNIETEIQYTKTTVKIFGPGFEILSETEKPYIRTNGRYQYVPNGLLITESNGSNISPGFDHGQSGVPGGAGNSHSSVYLPKDAVERIFNVDAEEAEDGGSIDVDTAEMKMIEGGDSYYDITVDANTFFWLPRIVFTETYDEPLEDALAVANVVLNRVKFSEFPETVYGVIYDTKYATQFTPVATTGVRGTPTEEAFVAAFLAIEGYNNIDNCMYFVKPNRSGKNTAWFDRDLVLYDTIGSHRFYYKEGDVIPDEPVEIN